MTPIELTQNDLENGIEPDFEPSYDLERYDYEQVIYPVRDEDGKEVWRIPDDYGASVKYDARGTVLSCTYDQLREYHTENEEGKIVKPLCYRACTLGRIYLIAINLADIDIIYITDADIEIEMVESDLSSLTA